MDLVDLIARQLARELGRSAELDDLRAMGHQGASRGGTPLRRRGEVSRFGGLPATACAVRCSTACAKAPRFRQAHARIRALEPRSSSPNRARRTARGWHRVDPRASEQKLTEASGRHGDGHGGWGFWQRRRRRREPAAVDTSLSPKKRWRKPSCARSSSMRFTAAEDERELVRRHYLEGERFDHVAASLGLSKSWGSRLHTRAVARLTKRLRSLAR
jgi:RNA polymerase sigma factor for flagellar operon FliA